MKTSFCVFAFAWILCLPWQAAGQNAASPSPQPDEPKISVVKIVLHPAAEPRPALKYLLLPPFIDRKPGNAAMVYNKITAERYGLFSDSNDAGNDLCKLLEAPLSDLRREEPRKLIGQFEDVARDTIRAAHYESCDWQLPLRDGDPYMIPLPEMQQSRSYARVLAAKARLQIAEGKFDEAIRTLQAGFAFARHVAAGQTIIHGLVGKSIAGMMSYQLRELIQQPDAPNLYWALSSMPRPIVDFRPGLDTEFDSFYLTFPKLRNLDKKIMTVDEARQLGEETMLGWINMCLAYGMGPTSVNFETRMEALGIILVDYPRAKKYLIDGGMAPEKVEAMPVAQVVLISLTRHYDEARDDLFKWLYSNDADAAGGLSRISQEFFRKMKNRDVFFSLEKLVLPGLQSLSHAKITNERDFAALQILEALRIYAAGHHGRLPERLSDITEVPVPLDPIQGKPFFYHAEGNTATLESPNPPDSPLERYLKYEIQMVPNDK